MRKKILIIVGGGTKLLEPFKKEGEKLGIKVDTASFKDIEYRTRQPFNLKVKGRSLEEYGVIYLRLVGKRFEDASVLVDYAREKGIKIVDRIFEKSRYIRLPITKSLETKLLLGNSIPVPKSYFGSLAKIQKKAPGFLGFPLVVKGTYGKQGHAVWLARDIAELDDLVKELRPKEKEGKRFLAQEFIRASQRLRVLVIGGKAIACITRPTRWRKRFVKRINGEFPIGEKKVIFPIPREDAKLAVSSAKALGIDIAGVDILHQDKGGKAYVLEVNSAPRWEAIKKDSRVSVEREILKFLDSRI